MRSHAVPALLALAFAALPLTPVAAQSGAKVVMEEFMVPAKDAGIEIYVRNKRPEGMTQFSPDKTVVYVHGRDLSERDRLRSSTRRQVLDGPHRRARF
jgi:hypothetical protein